MLEPDGFPSRINANGKLNVRVLKNAPQEIQAVPGKRIGMISLKLRDDLV
jgi:hypothetical protein